MAFIQYTTADKIDLWTLLPNMSVLVVTFLLSIITGVAGMVHLVAPSIFMPAMPPYIPFHLECIYLTGVLELMASIGLWIPRLKRLTARLLSAYFVAILPAHLHVAIHKIPMFGIDQPALLWGRVLFQSVFIYGSYWLSTKDPQ